MFEDFLYIQKYGRMGELGALNKEYPRWKMLGSVYSFDLHTLTHVKGTYGAILRVFMRGVAADCKMVGHV